MLRQLDIALLLYFALWRPVIYFLRILTACARLSDDAEPARPVIWPALWKIQI